MMVRFATVCDHSPCRARSEEYTAWPSCTECGQDTCPAHQSPGTFSPGDGDRGDRCLCLDCAAPTILCPRCDGQGTGYDEYDRPRVCEHCQGSGEVPAPQH